MQRKNAPTQQSIPKIVFEGEFMLVNGHQISYEQQNLSRGSFYMPDLGIDLPMEAGVKEFDSQYFDFYLLRKLLKELQLIVPQIGLKLLSQMPNLSDKTYSNLMLRLSLSKVKQYLMDPDAYLHLWHVFTSFGYKNEDSKIEMNLATLSLNLLDQPYKRMLYMMEHISTSDALKQVLKVTAKDLITEVVQSSQFINLLTERKQQSDKGISRYFLSNLINAFQTLLCITRGPQQTDDRFDAKYQRILSQLFRKECLQLIAVNFQYLFNFDRRNLMTVLALIAAEKGKDLWPQIIAKKYHGTSSPRGKTNSGQHSIPHSISASMSSTSADKVVLPLSDNTGTFLLMMINNFYEGDHANWDNTVLILDTLVRYSFKQSQTVVIKIFLEICRLQFNRQIINMALLFIKKNYQPTGKPDAGIEEFLLEFVGLINAYIGNEYSKYRPMYDGSNKFSGKFNPKNLNLFLKVYSTLFEYQQTQLLIDLDCLQSLGWLMSMTRNRGGIVEGARLVFLRQKNLYFVEQALQRNQNVQLNSQMDSRFYKQFSLLNMRETKKERFINFLQKME